MLVKVGLPILLVGAFALSSIQLGNPTLGLVELEGGTEVKKLSASAIPPGGKIVGRIKNKSKTPRPYGDVTFEVVRTGSPPPTPPTSNGESKVVNGDETKAAANSPNGSGSGFKATVTFGDDGPSPMTAETDPYDFEIDISTTGNGAMLEVWITPSDSPPEGGSHADVFSGIALTSQEPGGMRRLVAPSHAIGSIYLENAESGSSGVEFEALSGSCTLPAGVFLQSVTLRDPSAAFAPVAGAQHQIDGSSFQITGFSALAPGEVYELRLGLSAVPHSGYLVSVLAGS